MHVHGFSPIESAGATVLVLGTMPGKISLREQRYYAHPHNAFWRITGEILGFDPALPYEARAAALVAAGIALWDVLQACTRASSLDSDIVPDSVVPNDFGRFFAGHPRIRRVCFNGAAAANLYMKHVLPGLAPRPALDHVRLPSTSPANASVPFSEKLRAWRIIASPA